MSATGFEGFEKRLELHFSGDDPILTQPKTKASPLGLRLILDFDSLVRILTAVQCTVVSAVGNRYFDAYVLSESSLFVYPTKIVIKTCGTTQLLKSVRPLIHVAASAHSSCFLLCALRYTRGSFIFPQSQPFPHTSFADEVHYLHRQLPPSLRRRKASVMPSKLASHSWHVFTAANDDVAHQTEPFYTVEVCMTELDRTKAGKFFQPPGKARNGDVAGREMTMMTGIADINSRSVIISDFGFDPCGYSMNGIDQERYSTIHVTPEDGFSYASFECVGSAFDDVDDLLEMLKKVVQVFRPGTLSVSTTGATRHVWARVGHALEGMKRRSCTADEFPMAGSVVFQTFTVSRRK
ncbi:S-adenosylmethionine decarboxylase proenzyme 4 [Linum grandiflorum]